MQLVKKVLDEAYGNIRSTPDSLKDALILEEIERLTEAYKKLKDKTCPPIDYAAPETRFAYIYKYTVAHADYIMQFLNNTEDLRNLFSKDRLEVACLGGGPGSDLLGMLKYMSANNVRLTLKCFLYDKETAWGESWGDVADKLSPPYQLYTIFQPLDVTKPEEWNKYTKYQGADLFTMSFFMSEVWWLKDAAEPFFDHCINEAKKDALFLFIDNDHTSFFGWFDSLVKKHDLESLSEGSERMHFDFQIEKSRDLGEYFEKFSEKHWPKCNSELAYRVVRKR